MISVRRALYGKLAGDVTLTGLLGAAPAGYAQSIFYQRAPQGAEPPYVILNKQAGTPRYAFSEVAFDEDMWLVKGIDRSESADVVETISERLDTLLTDATLSISSRTALYLRRESDLAYAEVVDGATYRHAGHLFRLVHQAA